jgi:hypothetical protein
MTDKVIRIPIIVLNIFWWDLEDLLLEKMGEKLVGWNMKSGKMEKVYTRNWSSRFGNMDREIKRKKIDENKI